jgi:uncharacterized protein (DUF1015 family)
VAEIVPFRALRFDPKRTKASIDDLVAPPYDVISVEEQEALYQRSPHNVVRLILGKQSDADSPTDNRYTRSARHLKEWIESGILREDAALSYYVYEQTFEVRMGHPPAPRSFTRRGVLTALKLEPFGTGKVYAHEETFPSHKADRLQLFRACRANFSPVFGLVPDEGQVSKFLALAATQRPPDVEIKEGSGVVNRLWVVSDPSFIRGLTDALARRSVFIADGHHRYETACNYQKERREQAAVQGPQPCDYVLMMCVPMSDPGLIILPTHRVVQPERNFDVEALLTSVAPFFEQQPIQEAELYALAETRGGPVSFGLVIHQGRALKLTAKPSVADAMRSVAPQKSDAWRGLDTAILQELLVKKVLGQEKQPPMMHSGLCFTKDVGEVLGVIGKGLCQLGFVMRPTAMEHVRAVAERGERMPQKSTYFSPKLLSGLVMRRL